MTHEEGIGYAILSLFDKLRVTVRLRVTVGLRVTVRLRGAVWLRVTFNLSS